ncbi:hypothetical protein DYB35_012601 [Aphanomyces astaci]|uniref:Retrovirus-related Pol polyprotein from transposon TNT 1-94-like beta-barrel domain-containing protein n=1 Tax=Aphanomyces astaci TaxID=112090 RepID=A0A418DWQ1_APHAT|nr:hypothetical protein DYB35_012601 [Aphanomyces astaci]
MSPSMSSYKSPVVLLNEDNWNVWRTYYRGRLMSKGLWYIMAGSPPPSSRGNESSAATDTRTLADDEKAYGLLIESIETSQYECIEHATTANAAYTALSDHHEPKTKADENNPSDGHQASYAREEYLFTANDTPAHLPDSTAISVLNSQHQVIVDSGASSHMTGDTSNLRDISDCNRSITVANGTRTVATKKGTMSITTSLGAALHLTDVLLVAGCPRHSCQSQP